MNAFEKSELKQFVKDGLSDYEERLTSIEKDHAVYKAITEEKRRSIMEMCTRIQDDVHQTRIDLTKDITSIKSGVNKLGWIVISAVILSLVHWLFVGSLVKFAG